MNLESILIIITCVVIITIVIKQLLKQPVEGVALMRHRETGKTWIARVNDKGAWSTYRGQQREKLCPDTWELVEWL